MLLGVVSLLVVLALVGLVAVRQMRTALPHAASAASASGTIHEQSRQIQSQVAADVAKALQEGVEARREAPDQ